MSLNDLSQVSEVKIQQLTGYAHKVGTPTSVTVLEIDASHNILRCSGTVVPTDADAGFAKGCEFRKTDGAVGTTKYINEGSATSCDFNAIESVASVITGVTAGTGLSGGGTSGTVTLNVAAVPAASLTLASGAMYRGSAGGVGEELLKGTANQILEMDGGGGFPGWYSMSGDATMAGGVVTAKAGLKTDLVTLGLIGTVAEFGFPFNAEVATEQATAFCKAYDHGTTAFVPVATSSSSGEYTANYQLWPDTETEDDAVYFGGATPFGVIYINVSATAATYGADSVAWEYWNGAAWSALTILWDQTDSTAQDGLRPFQADGHIIWSAPSDWVNVVVDSQDAYWVRARIVAGFNVTQIPLLDSALHATISDPVASEMPAEGTIGRGRISFITNSGANNNTNIILCNLTKGTASAVTALTKALQVNEVANFNVKCDKDDQIAIYVTQEDGTTEFANGILELNVVKT